MGDIALVAVVGFLAAAINGVVGSGTLLTYPVLLGLGLSPVVANGTSSAGLAAGGMAAGWAYRSELRDRMRILAIPVVLAMIGGGVGALLVVMLPASVFDAVVPWLIVFAVVMVAVQPVITRSLRKRPHHLVRPRRDLPIWTALLGTYAGYFGAGQGVMYYSVLGLRYDEDLQHVNAAKNLLGPLANVVGAIVFILAGFVSWPYVVALWVGSILGGYFGARTARKVSPLVLRVIVIVIGIIAAISMWLEF